MAAVVANLSLVVGFSRRTLESTINTTVDHATHALPTATHASTNPQHGVLADTWISWIRSGRLVWQTALFGLSCQGRTPITPMQIPADFPIQKRGFWMGL